MQVIDGTSGERWPAEEVARRTAGAAATLDARGVRRGDRVLLSCAPSPATVVAYLAIRRLGAVVVPANTAYTPTELTHIVDDVRPVLAVLDEPHRLSGSHPACTADDLDGPPNGDLELDHATRDAPAMIAFTSGTTGTPKGAVLTNGNLDAGARSVVQAWRWSSDDVLVLPLPLFHMHGLGVGINGTLAAGAAVVVLPRFDVDAVIDAVRTHDATMLFGVPTMWSRLADSDRAGELANLRLAVSGSAPMTSQLWRRVQKRTGLEVLERYGMSETVMLTSNPSAGERRPGTVGLPLPGAGVRLADDGGVEVRGPNVFQGYWERPDATAEAFTDDGWFRTGDVGEYDDAGYLRLVGRSSDLIISGGYNVYPREVEDALRSHPAVEDCAVVGAADEEWGEVVTAYLVLGRHVTTDELSTHLHERVAAYKRPRRWHVLDELPRNAMGKVVKSALRAQ